MQPLKEDCIVPGEADRGGGLQIALGSGCRTTSTLLLDTAKLKILVGVIEPRRTCFGDVSKVFQNFDLQHINIQGILRLSKKLVDVLFVVAQSSLTDFLSLFRARNSLATSRSVRSSQTIFIRIFYTSQFVKTVGLEDVFGFPEIRILNFLTNKKGNLREKLVNSQSWQGH